MSLDTPDELAPPAPDYDDNGVDRTLISANLRLTPLECLQALEDLVRLAERVKRRREPIPPAD
ncbi:MAG: hypothetical protein U0263_26030 [Polyangiaceae bacterium]